MVHNPNWPLIEYAISFNAGPMSSPLQGQWCDVTGRTQGKVNVRRGKQYELDQVQPAEMTITLRNDDGAFDPTNGAGPYAGKIVPYRLIRARAQYPATVNLLTADQATARFSSAGAYTGSTLPAFVYQNGVSVLSIVAGPGSINSYSSLVLSGAAVFQGVALDGFSAIGGASYSVRLIGSVTTAVAISAEVGLQWYDVNGALISTSAATPIALSTTPANFTFTAVAPANTAGARIFWVSTTTPASNVIMRANSVQVEKNTSVSAYATPGTWYSLYTGFIERWPQEWTSVGNKGLSNLTCVDLFSFLANRGMHNVFEADLLAYNPNFMYHLDETNGSSYFSDQTGKRGPAFVYNPVSPFIKAGTSISSADNAPLSCDGSELTGGFLGSPGPVVTTEAGPILTVGGLGFLPTNGGAIAIPAGPQGIGPPTSGQWTRIIAAKATLTTDCTNGLYPWWFQSLQEGSDYTGMQISIVNSPVAMAMQIGTSAHAGIGYLQAPGLAAQAAGSPPLITDGDWHLYLIAYDPATQAFYQGVDGRLTGAILAADASPSTVNRFDPSAWADLIGMNSVPGNVGDANWVGDLAYATELPTILSIPQWADLYQSWRNAWATNADHIERSDQRYQRILNWLNCQATEHISVGSSIAYGPAIDVVGGSTPTDALTALQNVVDTELGQHFVAADGSLVFKARSDRYNLSPVVTFGENVAGGEIPYTDLKTDFDPTRITNDVTITALYGSAQYVATDTASEALYGNVSLTRNVNSMDPDELIAQAQYLIYQNRQPLQRLEALPVSLSAHPSAWPSVLGLELGSCATVNRRPSGAPLITMTGFVEQVTWDLADDSTAMWTAQISSNALHQFFQFDSATYGLLDGVYPLGY